MDQAASADVFTFVFPLQWFQGRRVADTFSASLANANTQPSSCQCDAVLHQTS